jgi:ABC-2 type transport system ATP-binding protein
LTQSHKLNFLEILVRKKYDTKFEHNCDHRIASQKTNGHVKAVEDVSFVVNQGEIFGLLGPNGAGKTTTVECITGLRHPDGGTISVLGLDPQVDGDALHQVVGIQLQFSTFPDKLKVGEILDLYQSFYPHPANPEELAQALGLGEKLGSYYKTLSGGQKQRLSVALALIGQPKIAVLDEMTTGLDPQARLDAWELIERTRDRGTTVVLVTHYMEEAERLCDRVGLIDQGRIIALDTQYGLTEKVTGGKQVRFIPSKPFDDRLLKALPEVKTLERQGKHVRAVGSGQLVNAIILTLAQNGIEALDVQMEMATLEDAFVKLTGRHIHENKKDQST